MVPDVLLILLVALYVVVTLRDVYASLRAQRMLAGGGMGNSGVLRGSKVTPLGGGGGGDGGLATGSRSDSYNFTTVSSPTAAAGIGAAAALQATVTRGVRSSGDNGQELDVAGDAGGRPRRALPNSELPAYSPLLVPGQPDGGKGDGGSRGPVAESAKHHGDCHSAGKQSYGKDASDGGSRGSVVGDGRGSAVGLVDPTTLNPNPKPLLATAELARWRWRRQQEGDETVVDHRDVPGGPSSSGEAADREGAQGSLEREELS